MVAAIERMNGTSIFGGFHNSSSVCSGNRRTVRLDFIGNQLRVFTRPTNSCVWTFRAQADAANAYFLEFRYGDVSWGSDVNLRIEATISDVMIYMDVIGCNGPFYWSTTRTLFETVAPGSLATPPLTHRSVTMGSCL